MKRTWLYCLPALLVLVGVAGYPLLKTLIYGFTDARLGGALDYRWVGLENFKQLFLDPDWWRAVANTFMITLIAVPLETLLGLLVALYLSENFAGRGWLRACILIPWIIPSVVSARMWAWIFNDIYGFANEALLRLGLIQNPLAWLADWKKSLGVVIFVDVWKTTPFMALLILAALSSIPKSLYEAAAIEGISRWHRFWGITFPWIMPALNVAVIFRTLDSLRIFDLPFVLTSNSRATSVMSVYARQQQVDFQDVGYGSAASFLIFALIAGGMSLYFWMIRSPVSSGSAERAQTEAEAL